MMLAAMDAAGVPRPGTSPGTPTGRRLPPARDRPRRATPSTDDHRGRSRSRTGSDEEPVPEPIEVLLAELDALVGLQAVKDEVAG